MRPVVLAFAFAVATGARAEDDGIVVRQLVGLGASVSDSGPGVSAQLGIRISPILLRVTLDIGGGATARGYGLLSARADWLFTMASGQVALVAGLGYGSLTYGFILDSPTAQLNVLMPEVGILLGPNNWFGRLLLGVTGLAPLQPVSHKRDAAGAEIAPPQVMATLLLSL
jgi:hypothetical protein